MATLCAEGLPPSLQTHQDTQNGEKSTVQGMPPLRTEEIRNAYFEEFKKAIKGLSTKDQKNERLVIQEAIKDRFLDFF